VFPTVWIAGILSTIFGVAQFNGGTKNKFWFAGLRIYTLISGYVFRCFTYKLPLVNLLPSISHILLLFNVVKVWFHLDKLLYCLHLQLIERVNSSVPNPLQKCILCPFSPKVHKPISLPKGTVAPFCRPVRVLLLPPNDPEFTTTGLSDSKRQLFLSYLIMQLPNFLKLKHNFRFINCYNNVSCSYNSVC
jgi:hypothetical protein